MTQRIAATTVLAVVAAIATSAWLTVLVVASYESGLSAAAGGQLSISGTPDGTRAEIERALEGAARETGASLLLALTTETPEGIDIVFVPLAGDVEEPVSPRVHYSYAAAQAAASADFRGFYATDATGPRLDALVEALSERGFSAQGVTETLAGHLVFHLTEPANALLVLSVGVLVLQAFGAEAASRRHASFVRATVGWSQLRDAGVELRGLAVLMVVVVAVATIGGLVVWGIVGDLRRPGLVLPPAVALVGATSLALLVTRAAFALRPPLSSGTRGELVRPCGQRQGALRPGVHVVLTALVIVGVLATAGALHATRRAVEAAVLLEPYADAKVLRVGIAGALDDDFTVALADVTREQLGAGTAVLRDTGGTPGTLVVTPDGEGAQEGAAVLWARAAPSAAELADLSFELTADVFADGAPLGPPADPVVAFDVHEVDDPARAAGVREAELLPDVVPFDVVVQVPLDQLADDVLGTAAGNGRVLFESSDSVDAALAQRGAAGFVQAWNTVGDEVALVLARCRRATLVATAAALLTLALLLVSTVRAALEHVRSGRQERRVLRTVGRTSWTSDRGPVTRRAALTGGAAAAVVPLVVLLARVPPVGAVATGATVTIAELVVFATTVALARLRARTEEVRHGHVL
ncbi:hypothetical protein [Frigoribacterium salinisoli]